MDKHLEEWLNTLSLEEWVDSLRRWHPRYRPSSRALMVVHLAQHGGLRRKPGTPLPPFPLFPVQTVGEFKRDIWPHVQRVAQVGASTYRGLRHMLELEPPPELYAAPPPQHPLDMEP